MWQVLAAVLGGLLLVWVVLVVAVYVVGRKDAQPTRLHDLLRLVADVVRLLKRLAADPEVPRGVRIGLGLLVV